MANKPQLSRDAYVAARARGCSKAEAARRAGSRAKRPDTLSKQGAAIEAEEGVSEAIAEARRTVVVEIEDDLDLARHRARQVLEDPHFVNLWSKAWDFLAKIGGHFAPKKVEHSGKVDFMDLIDELDAEDNDA